MKHEITFKHHSFLNQIPQPILEELDLNVLWIPNEEQKKKILLLEKKTGTHIVLYKKDVEPQGRHLCKTIRSADLDQDQIRSVLEFEQEQEPIQDLIVVAYQRPVVLF
ncbi:hypothetical protein LFX25_14130 [Leptospira sp. FAT2]|uniref:hypothetical protein n=1 Tax=Leptospira sanjuanensis TaxID=2879643 RepID=UPI001EE9872E|nr:hypothetical protein [Leptospira sanjuanensis]MCG6194383.1 hypothetical protein [Leptospira sanjuanensis]